MYKLLFSLLSFFLLFASCKPKTEHTIVQGYVKTFGSEVTHAGIEIELRQDGSLPLDITTSNADGWYRLEGEFEVNKRQYLYTVNTPPLHQALDNQPFDNFEVQSGGVQHMNLEIPPYSWVNIHFKNIDPCDQNDLISFYNSPGGIERINGGGVNEYFLWRTTGNKEVTFRYTEIKCGISEIHYEPVGYVSGIDTVDFEVLY